MESNTNNLCQLSIKTGCSIRVAAPVECAFQRKRTLYTHYLDAMFALFPDEVHKNLVQIFLDSWPVVSIIWNKHVVCNDPLFTIWEWCIVYPRWRVYYRVNMYVRRMVEAVLKDDQYYSKVPRSLGPSVVLDNISRWPYTGLKNQIDDVEDSYAIVT